MSAPLRIEDVPVKRNTTLLAAGLALQGGVMQMSAAVSALTLVLVTGITGILGVGPAILLAAGAAAALVAGRLMDRFGRIPVIAGGFLLGVVGTAVVAAGTHWVSTPLVIGGFVLVGCANGTAQLMRGAGGDLYPPDRRGRGISLVLFGAVFGAVLGPVVFTPLFGGTTTSPQELTVPWLVAGAFAFAGFVVVLFVRPDPKRVAELYYAEATGHDVHEAAPLRSIVRRPGIVPALLAALASFSTMTGVMNLAGYVIHTHGHDSSSLFPIISAHILGMYGLVLVVGQLVDRFGRTRALVSGLCISALSCGSLAWITGIGATAVALFGLGLGWSFSYVAATSQLQHLTRPDERGRILGFNDLLASGTGALLALGGGYTLSREGAVGLGVLAAVVALAPIPFVLASRMRARAAAPEAVA